MTRKRPATTAASTPNTTDGPADSALQEACTSAWASRSRLQDHKQDAPRDLPVRHCKAAKDSEQIEKSTDFSLHERLAVVQVRVDADRLSGGVSASVQAGCKPQWHRLTVMRIDISAMTHPMAVPAKLRVSAGAKAGQLFDTSPKTLPRNLRPTLEAVSQDDKTSNEERERKV